VGRLTTSVLVLVGVSLSRSEATTCAAMTVSIIGQPVHEKSILQVSSVIRIGLYGSVPDQDSARILHRIRNLERPIHPYHLVEK
jgi:hypothetical protein